MSKQRFMKDFTTYFTELTDYDKRRVEEMYEKYAKVEIQFRDSPSKKIVYVDKQTGKNICKVDEDKVKSDDDVMKLMLRVCDLFHIHYKSLVGRQRLSRYVIARALCVIKMREMGMTLSDIGRIFNRDHSTVIYNLRLAENMISMNQQPFTEYWEELNQTA